MMELMTAIPPAKTTKTISISICPSMKMLTRTLVRSPDAIRLAWKTHRWLSHATIHVVINISNSRNSNISVIMIHFNHCEFPMKPKTSVARL